MFKKDLLRHTQRLIFKVIRSRQYIILCFNIIVRFILYYL